MKIKNVNLANTALGLKSGTVTGDADGVFDLPEKEAKALLSTPGWSPLKKGKSLDAPAASAEPDLGPEVDEPDLGPEVDDAVNAVTLPEDAPDDEEEVDLDTLTKAELLDLAEEHAIETDPKASKAQIKAAIEEALG